MAKRNRSQRDKKCIEKSNKIKKEKEDILKMANLCAKQRTKKEIDTCKQAVQQKIEEWENNVIDFSKRERCPKNMLQS